MTLTKILHCPFSDYSCNKLKTICSRSVPLMYTCKYTERTTNHRNLKKICQSAMPIFGTYLNMDRKSIRARSYTTFVLTFLLGVTSIAFIRKWCLPLLPTKSKNGQQETHFILVRPPGKKVTFIASPRSKIGYGLRCTPRQW